MCASQDAAIYRPKATKQTKRLDTQPLHGEWGAALYLSISELVLLAITCVLTTLALPPMANAEDSNYVGH